MQYLKRDQTRLTFKDFLLLKSLKPQLATFLLLLLEVWRKTRLVGRRIYIFLLRGQLCNKSSFLPKLGAHKAPFPPKYRLNASCNGCGLAHFPLAETRVIS